MDEKQKVKIDASGRTVTAYIQREHQGWFWATTSQQNADTGWTLKANGEALREQYRDGERLSSLKVGTWKLA